MRRLHRSLSVFTAISAIATAATAHAQAAGDAARGSIAPGMTRDEVVRALGAPAGERTAGVHSYLFYGNGCERRCGTSDVVALDDGHVVDAVFRSPARHYTGRSSSPTATRAAAAAVDARPAARPVARPAAHPAARAARPAVSRRAHAAPAPSIRSSTAAAAAPSPQTAALVVRPRRAGISPVAADSVGRIRQIADTATSTGTRFGSPLTTVPGPATPQAPGLGAPLSRDSGVRNGVALPPGSRPVPFQGAKLAPTDSARVVNEQRQSGAVTTQPTPARPPR